MKRRLDDARQVRDKAEQALKKAETRRENLERMRNTKDPLFTQQDLDEAKSEFKSATEFYRKRVEVVELCKFLLKYYR